MNRRHDLLRRMRAFVPLRRSAADNADGHVADNGIVRKWSVWVQCCVVAAALCCAAGPTLVAAESSDPIPDETQAYDAPSRRGSRVTTRTTATTQPEPLDAGPIYEGAPPDGAPWQEPLGEWSDGGDSCDAGGPCGCMPGVFWGRAEALYWWVRGSETPPLLTTSPSGTSMANAGVLPAADILFGDQRLNATGRGGGRFTLGYWLDPYGVGIEDTFFFLGNAGQSYSASSNGSPILARPFFNTLTGDQDAFLLAFPNVSKGSVAISSSSDVIGNEVNFRQALYVDCRLRVDCLVGYRLLQVSESLGVHSNTQALAGGAAPADTTFVVQDTFDTRNQFNGGQIGFKLRESNGPWFFDVAGKFAIGGVTQRVVINGTTVTTPPAGSPTTYSGGILALPSNIGTYQQTKVGYLPELNLNLGYQFTPQWKINFGYTLIFLWNVARPGDQVSLRLDPSQFPPGTPATSPVFAFKDTDFWLQGLNLGIERSF